MPHREIELHLHPRDPRGRIRSVRLRPRTARGLAAALLAFLVLLIAGVAAAPRAVRVRLSERDYRAGVALRQELGERLQALISRLEALSTRSRDLWQRDERIARIYGLEAPAAEAPPPRSALGAVPETIFSRRIAEGNRIESEIALDLDRIAAALDRIEALERERPELAETLPVGAPILGGSVVPSSSFGPRRSPYTQELEFHSGMDLAAPRGTPVLASAAGVVVWTGVLTPRPRDDWWRLGRAVVLRHGELFRTLYGHLDTVAVRPGERVRRGQTIGSVGDSGWATGPNLHYEIRRREVDDWIALDPREYLMSLPAPGPGASAAATAGDLPGPQPLPSAFVR